MSPAHRRLGLLGVGLGLALASGGCSAIIQPDPTRLGGTDVPSGLDVGAFDGGGVDAPPFDGGGIDAPMPDVPAPECVRDGDCDDGIGCTGNFCRTGSCVFTPNDAMCEAGTRCSDTAGCVPILCTSDEGCVDADLCNGAETCNPDGPGADPRTGCVAGTPLVCNDGLSCTDDSCNPSMGCVAARIDARCDDGVSCTTDRCSATAGPTGCENLPNNDVCNTGCTTGAVCSASGCMGGTGRDCGDGTDCTVDSCDATARACIHDPLDMDMDGAPARRSPSGMMCVGGTDCDDTLASVGPGQPELCNGRDDNCNGTIDEGCASTGEDCGSATPITLSGSGSGRVDGRFGDFAADYSACGGNGRDAVYYIDIDGLSDVRIDTTGSAVNDTVLAVGSTCDAGTFAALCNDDQDPGPTLTSRIWLHRVGPPLGSATLRIYILVKSFQAASTGDFRLNVQVNSAAADACGGVALDITGGGLVVGNLGLALGNHRGTCDPVGLSTADEAIFRIAGPSDNVITRLTAVSADFRPILYTRGTGLSSCGRQDAESACTTSSSGAPASAQLIDVAAPSGTSSYVFVDGASTGGNYVLAYDP